MDPKIPAMVSGLEQRTHEPIGCASAGDSTQATEGWSRFPMYDRIASHDGGSLIIPHCGIAGSNPAPATNFEFRRAQTVSYGRWDTLSGVCPAKSRREILYRFE